MRDLIFACLLGEGEAEKDALRLAQSIRTFGGALCFNPIWMLTRRKEDDLADTTRQALFSLGVRLIGFDVETGKANIAFTSYVTAAGIAEGLAQGETSYLALMANDTLVLQPPMDFLLPAGKSFGACPVHLKLLDSRLDEPVSEYWQLIYEQCKVDVNNIFPMQTIVDEQAVRAYFNAGMLVVRPERGLLRLWQRNFEGLAYSPEFKSFYAQNELYEIFIHQAVLAGSILSTLKPVEFHQLPFEVNYPLHLHSKITSERRPMSLSQLITCRYEEFADTFGNPRLEDSLWIEPELKQWLKSQE